MAYSRTRYLRFIAKPGNKQKRAAYRKQWVRDNRESYNWYQKMYVTYGKKANWPT